MQRSAGGAIVPVLGTGSRPPRRRRVKIAAAGGSVLPMPRQNTAQTAPAAHLHRAAVAHRALLSAHAQPADAPLESERPAETKRGRTARTQRRDGNGRFDK